MEEPYLFDDRGAWFDGKYMIMTFELLKLPEVVTYGFWTKVHLDGVLFSSNRRYGDFGEHGDERDWNAREGGYYLGVNDSELELVSVSSANNNRSDVGYISYFEWAYLNLTLMGYNSLKPSHLTMRVNGEITAQSEFHRLYDFPEPKMSHNIGAAWEQGAYVKHFRGMIWEAKALRGDHDDAVVAFADACEGTCFQCPGDAEATGVCLGHCNWNHYYNEEKERCQRCPLW